MSRPARAFHQHAHAVLDNELRRARRRLAELPGDRRLAVEDVSARVAAALVDGVLEQALEEPSLAHALASIYSSGDPPDLRAVPCSTD